MPRFRLPRDVIEQLAERDWSVRIARFHAVGGDGRFVRVLVDVRSDEGHHTFDCESFPDAIRELTNHLEVRSTAA